MLVVGSYQTLLGSLEDGGHIYFQKGATAMCAYHESRSRAGHSQPLPPQRHFLTNVKHFSRDSLPSSPSMLQLSSNEYSSHILQTLIQLLTPSNKILLQTPNTDAMDRFQDIDAA